MRTYIALLLFFVISNSLTAQSTDNKAVEIVMTPYKTTILADGKDYSLIVLSAVNGKGEVVTTASHAIHFEITGPGKFEKLSNNDPTLPIKEKQKGIAFYKGKAKVQVISNGTSGIIHFVAKAEGLFDGSTDIITISPEEVEEVTIDPKYDLTKEQEKPREVTKMLGADISFLPQLEDRGIKFSENGIEGDAIELLKKHGMNYVRLRVFNNPAHEKGYSPEKGFCDLEHTLAMAKRVKAANMKLLLDLHYSDFWADPGKQYKPHDWEGLSFEALKLAFYEYTKDVIQALKNQGTPADMVQIGNEINHGIVWPEGNVSNLDQLAQLLRAGTKAVKDVAPETVMMLHVALGGQNDESVFFIDNMLKRKVHFDVIGESYYPKWHGTLEDLENNLNDLATRYDKDVIVVEYSALKDEVNQFSFELPNGHGKGSCIWEPLNTWEKVFDEEGKANQLINKYDAIAEKYLD
jgi:beta-galactosidase